MVFLNRKIEHHFFALNFKNCGKICITRNLAIFKYTVKYIHIVVQPLPPPVSRTLFILAKLRGLLVLSKVKSRHDD